MFILSTHVPKTGGSSFLKVLQRAFDRSLMIDHPNHPKANPMDYVDEIRDREIKALHGHGATIEKWECYLPPFDAVAWIRDPYTRVMSHFQYGLFRLESGKAGPQFVEILKAGDFEAYCKIQENEQSKYVPIERFDDFSFIGIVDKYKRCLDHFSSVFLGINNIAMPRENINPIQGQQAIYNLTPEQKALVKKYNEKDIELYARAKERWI